MEIKQLEGLILSDVKVIKDDPNFGDMIVFRTECGKSFRMYHHQDCCEDVSIKDIVGDLSDLIGKEVIKTEETSSDGSKDWMSTFTWTYYDISTINTTVTISWYGTSNGYYSEEVSFEKVNHNYYLK